MDQLTYDWSGIACTIYCTTHRNFSGVFLWVVGGRDVQLRHFKTDGLKVKKASIGGSWEVC